MSNTLFQNLSHLTIFKTDWDKLPEDCKKEYSPFMINKYVSFSQYFSQFAFNINLNVQIPPEANYRYYHAVLPKRNLYFKYIKKTKKESLKPNEILALSQYFKCSKKDLDEIIEYADPESIKNILKSYNIKK